MSSTQWEQILRLLYLGTVPFWGLILLMKLLSRTTDVVVKPPSVFRERYRSFEYSLCTGQLYMGILPCVQEEGLTCCPLEHNQSFFLDWAAFVLIVQGNHEIVFNVMQIWQSMENIKFSFATWNLTEVLHEVQPNAVLEGNFYHLTWWTQVVRLLCQLHVSCSSSKIQVMNFLIVIWSLSIWCN